MKQHSLQLKPLSNGENINDGDLIVFYYKLKNCNNSNFKLVCQNVSNRPIKKSIIIVENPQWNTFLQDIASLYLGLNIFVLINDGIEKNIQWKEVIALKVQNHLTINFLNFNVKGTVLEKTKDLQGLHITGIAKHWYPFFNVNSKCKNENDKCIFDGFLVELLDAASKQLNFTWSAELSDDWGLQPEVGK